MPDQFALNSRSKVSAPLLTRAIANETPDAATACQSTSPWYSDTSMPRSVGPFAQTVSLDDERETASHGPLPSPLHAGVKLAATRAAQATLWSERGEWSEWSDPSATPPQRTRCAEE